MERTVSAIMVTLLLISMLTFAFDIQPAKAKPKTWTMDDDESAGFSKILDTVTEAGVAYASEASRKHWSMPMVKSFFEDGLDRRLTDTSETSSKWDFSNEVEWNDFAYVDDDSVELVIGLDDTRPNSYSELRGLIMSCSGELVDAVSMDSKISAVVADVPHGVMSTFVSEVEIAKLSRYIEPNVRFKVDFFPNDPDWPKQWGPRIIEADYAWNTTMGDSSVLVAVVDTGIDWNHPDLAANYVALGYDWMNNDPDPMDDHGHGTHCAGIIAAVLNNGIGIAGLGQVQIMAEKGLGAEGGRSDDLAKAIVHAVNQGADILSCSWGSYARSTVVHDALKYAYDHGVLVIGAAGNDATSVKHYPAAYDEVMTVTATDESDNPAEFTNFGNWVEVGAPGVHVYSTVWDDSYAYMSGTSMSAPHVSGVAALIWSQFPSMTRDQVRAQIRYTADDLGDHGFDVYYGYGRVNARRAVEQVPFDHDVLVLSWLKPQHVNLGSQVTINSTIFNMGTSDESSITVQLLVNDSVVDSATVSSLVNGESASVSCLWVPTVEGVYNVTSYVVPVPGENATENNALSAFIVVRIPKVIKVPDDYETIQGAIDAAIDGDTVFVASGTYYEDLWINKEGLTLVGEDVSSTIIQEAKYVVVAADNVDVNSFTIQNGDMGIVMYWSKGSKINNTRTFNNGIGIYLLHSANITLVNNNMTGNGNNLDVDGYGLSDFIHKVDTSNLVNGKPVYYWINEHDKQVPSDAGYIAAVNSTKIVTKDLNLTDNGEGVLLVRTSDSVMENVNISNNYDGIYLYESIDNNISRNILIDNKNGINSYYSNNNKINFNKLLNNGLGLFLEKSNNNTINNNKASNNRDSIYLRNSGYNVLRNNNMTNNESNFGVMGSHLSHFIQDIDTSNTVNGQPVYYWVNQKNKEITADAGYVAVVNSTNIAVKGPLNLTNNVHGVLFAYASASLIENVNTSNNTYGIYLYSSCNNAIAHNMVTSKSQRGIQLVSSNNNTIRSNMITDNYIGVGLWLSAENNAISNNAISNGTVRGVGLYLDHSGSNTISNNTVANNDYGIELYWSSSNRLVNNSMISNSYNFGVYGGSFSNFIQDIDTLNVINGSPIYYWLNQQDKSIPSDAGYVAVINCTNISVKDLTLKNNGQGVLLAYTKNSTVKNVSTTSSIYGIMLQNSYGNNIIANNVANNDKDGIYIWSSDGNTIEGNTAVDNGMMGIYLLGSRNNVVSNNTSLENGFGVALQYGSDQNIIVGNKVLDGAVGIYLTESKGNVVSENTASDNTFSFLGFGICLEWSSSNNMIIDNNIINNNYGIMLSFWAYFAGLPEQNNNNTIYHNNLINNPKQVLSLNSINTWDNDYPSGGNHWSDYTGNDTRIGPYQNMTGSDGIGDMPYIIDEDNKDRYPLTNPWKPLIPGDINKDGRVDLKDFYLAATAFGLYQGHPRWNPIADVNDDGKVDLQDIYLIAINYGKTYP